MLLQGARERWYRLLLLCVLFRGARVGGVVPSPLPSLAFRRPLGVSLSGRFGTHIWIPGTVAVWQSSSVGAFYHGWEITFPRFLSSHPFLEIKNLLSPGYSTSSEPPSTSPRGELRANLPSSPHVREMTRWKVLQKSQHRHLGRPLLDQHHARPVHHGGGLRAHDRHEGIHEA